MKNSYLRLLTESDLEHIVLLTIQLNPNIPTDTLEKRQLDMFKFNNYTCFGLIEKDELIGISSGWTTVRLYSGKQLEIDNVIIDATKQSKGYGSKFLKLIEKWAIQQNCETIELNTYVQNNRSHQFYFNQGYKILGFHFQKQLSISDK